MALVDAGVIGADGAVGGDGDDRSRRPSPAVLARISGITGIPTTALRTAWKQNRRHGYQPPATCSVVDQRHDTGGRRPSEPATPADRVRDKGGGNGGAGGSEPPPGWLRKADRDRLAAKTPSPGRRVCSQCEEELPVDDFEVMNPKTGSRMPWCRTCGKARRRRRFASAAELGVATFVRALLAEDSPFVGETCPDCGQHLEVGQQIEGCDVIVRHVACPGDDAGHQGGRAGATDQTAAGSRNEHGRTAETVLIAGPPTVAFEPPVVGWDPSSGEEVRWPAAGANVQLANGHMEIWGASGTGKTQFIKALLAQLARYSGTRFGIADFKNDYGPANDGFPDLVGAEFFDLWADGVPYNPLALGEVGARAIDSAVIEIRDAVATAAAAFTRMGHRQQDRLRALLEQAYRDRPGDAWPTLRTLDDLLVADEDLRPCDKRYAGVGAVMGDLSRNDIFRDGPPLGEAVDRRMIFGLSAIPGNGLTTVLAAGFVLSSLMLRIQALRPTPNTVGYAMVVDEAHRVSAFKAIETMVREGRSKSLAVILATQQPSDMPEIVGANAATRACFYLPDAATAAAAAKRLDPTDRSLPQRIRGLDAGEAFVRLGGDGPRLLRMAQLFRDGPRLGCGSP